MVNIAGKCPGRGTRGKRPKKLENELTKHQKNGEYILSRCVAFIRDTRIHFTGKLVPLYSWNIPNHVN